MAWIAEQLLTAIRDAGLHECITEERLVMLTGIVPQQVANAMQVLRKNQWLEKTKLGCHQLTAAGQQVLVAGENFRSGPKRGSQSGYRIWKKDTVRVRIWRAIRLRRKFSLPEIISLVVDENARGDITSNVRNYVCALVKAGYLVELPRREPGTALTSNGYKRWWLRDENDTGPQAPVWRVPQKTVYDPNTETEIDISGVAA
ncbi:MAG: hypothetical protein Q7S51_10305 [Gallionellaceae bacterium]|nr:hypothetical protein [Gallionellaceae bacterium]